MTRSILVTSALPYTNGAIHLGHLLEHIQTDIWVRFQKLCGNRCIYVCADDTHGTGTMLNAEQAGLAPEALIEAMREEHIRDFAGFGIEYDNYHSTHSEENRVLSELIFARLKDQGLIYTEEVAQLHDPERGMFLADRFVKGECPRCGAADQYGDNCDACSATYDATELGNPRSLVSSAKPLVKRSEHYFFDLPPFTEMLRDWTGSGAVQPEVSNKLAEWLDGGLKSWDISRDAPYFGFLIPGTEDKYFYVWMDAPIGYMASFKHLADRRESLDFDAFWNAGAETNTELHHFIGKDIVNFHHLFWPAVLEAAGFRKPTRIHTHGFITVDGVKMSKSRGTFIKASTYLEHLNPECLRYYYATKLNGTVDDYDINLEDFVQRVNSDLVGKVVNIASRCAGIINNQFDGELAASLEDEALWRQFADARAQMADWYEAGQVSRVMREVIALADLANQYITKHAPWKLVKQADRRGQAQAVCSQGLNLFRLLAIYLSPVLPGMCRAAADFLGVRPFAWADLGQPLLGAKINPYQPLFTRTQKKDVDNLVEASKEAPEADGAAAANGADEAVSIEDFNKIKLKVARVAAAAPVADADKLLRLTLDTGDGQRQVLAGISSAYRPEDLAGRLVVVVANLAPRKMRFGVSEGMVLAAGPGGEDIFLLSPDSGAKPGMDVR